MAQVDVLCHGLLGVSGLVGDGVGEESCVVKQRGCGLTEDVTRDPWQAHTKRGIRASPVECCRVAKPALGRGKDRILAVNGTDPGLPLSSLLGRLDAPRRQSELMPALLLVVDVRTSP